VKKATGKTWNEWFGLLDRAGAREMEHREIASQLLDRGPISNAWWAQTVTVKYERSRGLREIGQTKSAGFEIGVSKTLPLSIDEAWELIAEPVGLKIWLGTLSRAILKKGEVYKTDEGTQGEIRSIVPGKRLRLTWRPIGKDKSSTLQINLLSKGEKTSVRIHHERLSDAKEREEMRRHWKKVLENLQESIH
jgi:uncharacterized protein YndB with AHSA1/START domain